MNNNQIALNLKLDTTTFERELAGVNKKLQQLDRGVSVGFNGKTQTSSSRASANSVNKAGADESKSLAELRRLNALTAKAEAAEAKRVELLAKLLTGQGTTASEKSFANKNPKDSEPAKGYYNLSSEIVADISKATRGKEKKGVINSTFGATAKNLLQGFQFKVGSKFAERYVEQFEKRVNKSFNGLADQFVNATFQVGDAISSGIKKGVAVSGVGVAFSEKKKKFTDFKDAALGNKEKGTEGFITKQALTNYGIILEGAVADTSASLIKLAQDISVVNYDQFVDGLGAVSASLEGYALEIQRGYFRYRDKVAQEEANKPKPTPQELEARKKAPPDRLARLLFSSKDDKGNDIFTKKGISEILKKVTGKVVDPALTKEQLIQELNRHSKTRIVESINEIRSPSMAKSHQVATDLPKEEDVISRREEIKQTALESSQVYDEVSAAIKNAAKYSEEVGFNSEQTYVYLAAQFTKLRAIQNILKDIKNTTSDLGSEELLVLNKALSKFRGTLDNKSSKNPFGGDSKVTKAEATLGNARLKVEKLGNDFDTGYALGISNSGMSPEAAFELGETTIEALRKAQDSRSPSKETKKLGKDFGDGYIVGIKSKAKEVKAAAKEMFEASKKVAKDSVASAKEGASGIRAKYDGFKDQRVRDRLTYYSKGAPEAPTVLGRAVDNTKNRAVSKSIKAVDSVVLPLDSLAAASRKAAESVKSEVARRKGAPIKPELNSTVKPDPLFKFWKAVDIAADEIQRTSYEFKGQYTKALRARIEELKNSNIIDLMDARPVNKRSKDELRDIAKSGGYSYRVTGKKDGQAAPVQPEEPEVGLRKDEDARIRNLVGKHLKSVVGTTKGQHAMIDQFVSKGAADGLKKAEVSILQLTKDIALLNANLLKAQVKELPFGVALGASVKLVQGSVNLLFNGLAKLDDVVSSVDFKKLGSDALSFVKGTKGVSAELTATEKKAVQLKRAALALGVAFIGFQVLKPFTGFIKGAIEARGQVDSLYASMRASGAVISRNDFLDGQIAKANKAYTSVEAYSKLESSLKSTVGKQGGDAEGLTAKISSGLAKRGIGGEEATRFLAGISQIASKGVVSMEELRQQLSESLPASMSIAAESMGLTTAQFNELVASGSLLSSDFLPKFASQLDTVSGGLKTTKMSSAELGNAMLSLKDSVGKLLPVNTIITVMTKGVQALKVAAVPLIAILGGLLVGTLVTAAAGVYLLVSASAVATAALGLLATTAVWAGGAFLAIIAGMKLYSEIVGSSEKKIGRVRKELQGQIADQEKLNKAQANEKPKSFFGKVKEGYNLRKSNIASEEIQLNTQAIFEQMMANRAPNGSLLTDAQIQATSAKIQELKARAANGVALKLSPSEVNALGKQAEELQTKLSKQIDLKYNLTNQKATLAAAEANLNAIQQQINSTGLTASLKISKDETIRQIEDIKAELKRIATLELAVNINTQNRLAAEAGRESLAFAVTDSKINTEMSALTDAVKQNTTQAGVDAALKKASIAAMKQELALNSKQIAKDQKVVQGASQVQRDVIAAQSNGKQLEQLDFESLISVQKKLEAIAAASGTEVDANVISIIEAQKQTLQVTQQNKQLTLDITKGELELRNTIKELEISIKGLAVEVKSKVLEIARFGLASKRFKEDRVRPLSLSASDTQFSSLSIIKSQTEAYASAVRGIKDFNYGINQATQDLRAKILSVRFDTAKSAIGGISTRLAARGIDDKYGVGKLRDLAVKGLDISQGSQTATLEREREEIKRTFAEELRGQEANRKALRLDSESQIRDLRKQREENSFNQARSAQDIPLEITELQNQRDSLVLSVEALQKTITETNEQAKAYGLSNRAESFRATVPNINATDLEGTKTAMDVLYGQIDSSLANTIQTLQGIANTGDANITAELAKAKQLQDERLAAKAEEIALDKERQEQANKDLVREVSATQQGVIADLGNQATQTRSEILAVQSALNELLGSAGLQGNLDQAASFAVAQQADRVQAKIDEFKAVSSKLSQFATANQYTEAGLAGIMGIVGENSDKLDPSVIGALTVAADSIRESGNYQEVEGLLKDLIKAYNKGAGVLTANKDTIANAAGTKVRQDSERAIRDIGFDSAQAQIDGNDRFTANKKAKLSAHLQKVRDDDSAARQFNDAKNSGIPLDVARKTYDAMLKLSQLKFDNTMKGLATMREYVEQLRAPLESMLFKVGEDLGRGLGNALDTDEYNNKLNEVNAQFGQDLLELQEKYAEDPAGLAAATERLKELNDAKLDNVSKEFSTLATVLGTVKDAVLEVASSIAKLLIQKGVEKVLGSILGGVSGGAGGGLGGALGQGLASVFGGGKYAGGSIGAYANGGSIGCYASGGYVNTSMAKLQDVMAVEERRSGKNAIPIIAHEGEEVLSTLNNDAQFFRSLQSTGQWDMMKEGKSNFYAGGTIGGKASVYSPQPMMSYGGNSGSRGGTTINSNFNIQTKNVNEFYRSQEQVAASTRQRLEEASRRRG